ncbi:RNA polymerase II transcription mediator complex subunit 9-domain-containing protein [Annulohypoxylon truncatum]|uniref:RNA polymerase II transcription mediator complex subunit 9-domain-containing protein n=1 Tax=Annulohypoxylon truncatum TaxID=327061 RepID=UPI002008089A|nr:RNA polymerase II transcription mediator complex subunit 9-domain-containing protein [Annulohypoxylon truncatum]KAI1204716.1 RNA polymerase II transcription mediator complex subunit 9-domain-containing protein [Annulohypoxylon truncatum]
MPSSTPKPQPVAMPEGLNPDTLDTLTELAVLLNRLRMPTSTNTTGATPNAAAASTPAPPPPPPPPPPTSNQHQLHPHSQPQTANGATTTTNTGELSLKEIPPAADVLKHRFQRARALVRGLPDVGRGTREQEAEIAALEARLARQRDMLARLREMGARLAVADEEGEGEKMVVD